MRKALFATMALALTTFAAPAFAGGPNGPQPPSNTPPVPPPNHPPAPPQPFTFNVSGGFQTMNGGAAQGQVGGTDGASYGQVITELEAGGDGCTITIDCKNLAWKVLSEAGAFQASTASSTIPTTGGTVQSATQSVGFAGLNIGVNVLTPSAE